MSAITVAPEVESVKTRLKIILADWFAKRKALIVIRSRARHVSSWGSSAINVSDLSYHRGKGIKTDTKWHPLLVVGKQAFKPTWMDGVMSEIHRSIAALVLLLVGLVGCDYEPQAVEDVNPVRVAEMQKVLRDLWLGHIFWVQHVVLFNTTIDSAERDAADKQVLANAKQIASTVTPFYGEASARKFFALLTAHYAAVKEYSDATTAGNRRQQDAALARLASNTDLFAEFLNGVNPQYLPKATVRGLIAVHGAHHVLQINLYKKKDYAQLKETWPMMRQHVYLIADTLTTALVKQFPNHFS